MNGNKQTPASYAASMFAMTVLVLIYFNAPPWMRAHDFGRQGLGVANEPAPTGLVAPTLAEQIRSGDVQAWTHEQSVFRGFADIDAWTTPEQLKLLLDAKTPPDARREIYAAAVARKAGEQRRDVYFDVFKPGYRGLP